MPKTPPREDKQPQYQTPRRNRQVVTNRLPPEDYTDDDRPEIPKIRRASRTRTPYQFPESITKDQGSIEEQRKGDRSQKQHPDTIKATKKRASSAFTPPPLARLPKRAQRDRLVFLRAGQPIIIASRPDSLLPVDRAPKLASAIGVGASVARIAQNALSRRYR